MAKWPIEDSMASQRAFPQTKNKETSNKKSIIGHIINSK